MKFKETFDVPKLLKELEDRIKIPVMKPGIYDCIAEDVVFDGVYVTFTFRTEEKLYVTKRISLDRALKYIWEIFAKLGSTDFNFDRQSLDKLKGKSCKIFYQDELNIVVL